jgi:hypothetical protein
MSSRDPDEAHRASTPLELLFDLTFVVAVARAASQLHGALAEGQVGHALAGYATAFFGLWWAWVNFTWFASAYDTDDVPYRLLTLLQMAGVLVFAAGIPAAFQHFDYRTVVAGYVIMRLALVTQWLRAAHGDPDRRAGTLRYAIGVTVVQLLWISEFFHRRGCPAQHPGQRTGRAQADCAHRGPGAGGGRRHAHPHPAGQHRDHGPAGRPAARLSPRRRPPGNPAGSAPGMRGLRVLVRERSDADLAGTATRSTNTSTSARRYPGWHPGPDGRPSSREVTLLREPPEAAKAASALPVKTPP